MQNLVARLVKTCKRLFSTVRLAKCHHAGVIVVSKLLIPRILTGILFVAGGGCLTLTLLLGVPSFWYFPCVCALIPLGFVWWLCRPPLAAALSVGPLVAAVALLRYFRGMWFALLAACLIAAVILVLVALHHAHGWKLPLLPLLISVAYLAVAFRTDRLFTNKVSVKTFQMGIALDGKAPWGEVGPEWQDGTASVVLYRRVGTSYCYTAFKSQELRDHLAQKRNGTVTVEYNVFSDFGRERSYNVRSVDGIFLHNGEYVLKNAERFGGQILGEGGGTLNCW